MINLRRFPGVVFRFRAEIGFLLTFALAVVYLMHRWGLMCTNREIKQEIDRLCKLYEEGRATGNLCAPLCAKDEVRSVSCISQRSKKKIVFTAEWNKRLIVAKSSRSPERLNAPERSSSSVALLRKTLSEKKFPKLFARRSRSRSEYERRNTRNERRRPSADLDEKEFERKIRKIASEKLNITLTRAQLEELRFLPPRGSGDENQRGVEMENVLSLLRSQEYLLSRLFSDRDVFPQILGTCGHFYAVEHLETPKYNSLFALDDKTEWSDRMKLAVAIMDFVEEIETNFPDALYLCDVQMNHLGVSHSGRVKFLDLDLAYMKNVLEKTLDDGRRCRRHEDCDHLDCKSACDPRTNVCDGRVANDNLQMICEKIFIGWTMSKKVIVPGLLMSDHTPASLSALLRLCADSVRQPVHEDLRQKLYTTLTEMHQILLQKLSSESRSS